MASIITNLPATGLAILGLISIVLATRTLVDKSPDIEHDSTLSKQFLSPYTRYWIGRYYAGLAGIGAGFAFLVLAAGLYFGT
jgi:uncharacterized membrane protein YfcA